MRKREFVMTSVFRSYRAVPCRTVNRTDFGMSPVFACNGEWTGQGNKSQSQLLPHHHAPPAHPLTNTLSSGFLCHFHVAFSVALQCVFFQSHGSPAKLLSSTRECV